MRRLLILTLLGSLSGCALTPSDPVVIPGETAAPRPGPLFSDPFSAQPGSGMLETLTQGTFATNGSSAITYDPRLVPVGATAQVAMGTLADGTTVRLAVTGMLPQRTYGAHLHTEPCTDAPADAGPHYQHSAAPMTSPSAAPRAPASTTPASTTPASKTPAPKAPASSAPASPSAAPPPADPAYANPRNEVWLDFTADRLGAATATAVLTWTFDELKPPRSLVVHTTRTRTGEGEAGTAGERIACLTLPR